MTRIEPRLLLLVLLPALTQAAPATGLPGAGERAIPVPEALDPQQRWAALPPARQQDLRARYAAWRALPESERQRVRRAAAAVAALPGAERDALHARFLDLDRLYRDGWRLGPKLGAVYPQLQPLLGYLPDTQRAPMLALLHQLDAEHLRLLAVLSQRTPPQERARLREQLLAVAAADRGAWLRRRVEGR
ncbi:DUF3106 domain-containing protein [Stenotrophomonas mori]|uniref:DUF3106 domain-containing protein n=1 Tax=Stenotrophomonas mori TaxID=2871096 RepID=A0ABT0SKL3_9GAMM|nr:DUF3106 domain-containing protein [Stenotrophomonas mori]MCL7715444.1 DUF3106 domain-containing protein [Stenotrophomonas mori]